MYHYLGPTHRAQLATYKYSSGGSSFISTYVLGPYWNWLVTLFPTWVAPNTITLSGLLLVFANFLSLVALDGELNHSTHMRTYVLAPQADTLLPVVPLLPHAGLPASLATYTPTSEGKVPSWLLLVWAVCLFLYQSLDAIDGKQARRTNMAGPLGELFDHGCDALNTTLETIMVSAVTGLGRSHWTIVGLVSAMSNFFLTTWDEYHTKTLFLSSFSGPVEGILIICALFIATALLSPTMFMQGVLHVLGLEKSAWVREHMAFLNIPLGDFLMVLASLGLLMNAWTAYQNVRKHCRQERLSVWSPLLGLFPFVVQCVANITWLQGQGMRIMTHGPVFVPFLVSWGLSFAYLVGLVILAHVCRRSYPFWNMLLVPSVLLAVDAHLSSPVLQHSVAMTEYAVYSYLALSFAVYGYFVYDVIQTITQESMYDLDSPGSWQAMFPCGAEAQRVGMVGMYVAFYVIVILCDTGAWVCVRTSADTRWICVDTGTGSVWCVDVRVSTTIGIGACRSAGSAAASMRETRRRSRPGKTWMRWPVCASCSSRSDSPQAITTPSE